MSLGNGQFWSDIARSARLLETSRSVNSQRASAICETRQSMLSFRSSLGVRQVL